jgi:polar amino acid transport system permease protein
MMDVIYRAPPPRAVEPIRGGALFAGSRRSCPTWVAATAILLTISIFAFAPTTFAQSGSVPKASAIEVLWRWAPLLLWGFCFNLLISAAAMTIGTGAGVLLGLAHMSRVLIIRIFARCITEIFRNSPWLVLLFACILLLPFEIHIFGLRIPFPDWAKAIFGFSLPIMANMAEMVRGAVLSVPTSQWESAESLGYSRYQSYIHVILPQCIKRMLPPWMNLYSLVTMSTVNASVVGVSEILTLVAQAQSAEGSRPELLAPFYGFVLICFFAYCYPIGKWTQYLERKYQVML